MKLRFLLSLVLPMIFVPCVMAQEVHAEYWVSEMPNNMRLTELSIPLAHDAATHDSATEWAEDQDLDEKDCFACGVRAFDLRIGNDEDNDINKSGGGYFFHEWDKMNSFKDEMENHMPTQDQLFARGVSGIDPSQVGEFMILYIGREHMKNLLDESKYDLNTEDGKNKHWIDGIAAERKCVANLLKLLIDKYVPKGMKKSDVFIPYRKDLTLKDMRGKIIVFVGHPYYALKDYCGFSYEDFDGQDVWIPLSMEASTNNNFTTRVIDAGSAANYIGNINRTKILSYAAGTETKEWPSSKQDEPNEAQIVGEEYCQNYYEPNRSGNQMGNYFMWAQDFFHSKIDHLNNQNILFKSHLNGWTFAAGGLGTAADLRLIFTAKTVRTGANHMALDYIKKNNKPLGIVGMDYCGSNNTNLGLLTMLAFITAPSYKTYGKELTEEIIRHNYITREYHKNKDAGFISDVMICSVPRTSSHWNDAQKASDALAKQGYSFCFDKSCDDLLANYKNDECNKRIFFGVKRTCDPDSAVNNLVLIRTITSEGLNDYKKFHDQVSQLPIDEPFSLENKSEVEKETWYKAFRASYYYKPIKVLDLTNGGNQYGDLRGGIKSTDIHVFLWQDKNPNRFKDQHLLNNFTKYGTKTTTNNPDRCFFVDYGTGVTQVTNGTNVYGIKDYDNNTLFDITGEYNPTYISLNLHNHFCGDDDKAFDSKYHYKLCSDCHTKFDETEHNMDIYEATPSGFIHGVRCECGYGTYEECISKDGDLAVDSEYEDEFKRGIGKCSHCGAVAYQPAFLRSDSVYEISNEGQLHWFSRKVTFGYPYINAELKNNIYLRNAFLPVGILTTGKNQDYYQKIINTDSKTGVGYQGTFDGKGYCLENMTLMRNLDIFSEGMFSYVDGGTVKNLGLKNFNANTGKTIAASFAGSAKNAVFENLYSHQANITTASPTYFISVSSGITGLVSNCVMKNIYFTGELNGEENGKNCFKCGIGLWFESPQKIGNINMLPSSVSNVYCKKDNYEGKDISYIDENMPNVKIVGYEDFKSGKVCYLLNNGDGKNSNIWIQRISTDSIIHDIDKVDVYPVLRTDNSEEGTVYGSYKHGSTELTVSNSIEDSRYHSHPYDISADSEEKGNHDKAYKLSEGYPTWRMEENGEVYAKWDFTCDVCKQTVTPETKADVDPDKTAVIPSCTEKGHDYFTSTQQFNSNATFTEKYDHVTDSLGHDFSKKVLAQHPDGWSEGDAPDKIYIDGDGLYSYICSNDSTHLSENVKVLKDFTPTRNLELEVIIKKNPKENSYRLNDDIELTDSCQFKNIYTRFTTGPNRKYPTYTHTMKSQWEAIVIPFLLPSGYSCSPCEFYTVSAISGDSVVLKRLTSKIYGGTPVIAHISSENMSGDKTYELKMTAGNYWVIAKEPSTTIADGLTFTGTYTPLDVTGKDGYIMLDNAFRKIADISENGSVTCPAFTAYLSGSVSNDANTLIIPQYVATAVDALKAITEGNAEYYDTNGVKLNDLHKGVNIVRFGNGVTKKVILR